MARQKDQPTQGEIVARWVIFSWAFEMFVLLVRLVMVVELDVEIAFLYIIYHTYVQVSSLLVLVTLGKFIYPCEFNLSPWGLLMGALDILLLLLQAVLIPTASGIIKTTTNTIRARTTATFLPRYV